MPRKRITPNDPALEARRKNVVRREYKKNTKKKKKFSFEGEENIIIDSVVHLKLGGFNNTQIAKIVGISRGQVGAYLQDGNVQKKLIALQTNLPKAAFELGQSYMVEAVQSVVNIMRTTEDEALILRAAGEMFDRFGIPKVSRQEKQDAPEHPLSGEQSVMDKLRAASPEVQIKAAELQEMFEEGISRLLEQHSTEEVDNGNTEQIT